MRKFRLTRLAEQDLTGIWRYTLENWSREQADKYVDGLMDACSEVSKDPEHTGSSYEHVREGYRKYPYGRHVIFYKVLEDGSALIVRVLHEMMDFDRHL